MTVLPYVTPDVSPIDAELRAEVDDFEVEEIPAYPPAESGSHVFVFLEKRELTTRDAIRRLCEAVGANPGEAGWAGLKDKRAVTRQWVSLFEVDADEVARVEVDGVRVLRAARHPHKLRPGHLRGNQFRIRLRRFDAKRTEDLRRVLSRIETIGLPNYFGEQRFGTDGNNAERALRWVRDGARAPRKGFQRKLEMSALQSELFNRYVAERVRNAKLGEVFEGALVKKHGSGGLFVAADVPEVQARADDWELSPTGPIFGAKMRWPDGSARKIEEELLTDTGLSVSHFARWKRIARGTRRFERIPVSETGLHVGDNTVHLDFTLPAGSYATILMREILKRDAPVDKSS